jgi:hypothetical protein
MTPNTGANASMKLPSLVIATLKTLHPHAILEIAKAPPPQLGQQSQFFKLLFLPDRIQAQQALRGQKSLQKRAICSFRS